MEITSYQITILLLFLSCCWQPVKLMKKNNNKKLYDDEKEENEDKCVCLPIHPQQAYCHSDFGKLIMFPYIESPDCSRLKKKKKTVLRPFKMNPFPCKFEFQAKEFLT